MIRDLAGTASSDAMSLRFAIAPGVRGAGRDVRSWMAGNKTWYISTKPEFYGRFSVKTELTVLPADTVGPCPVCGKEVMNGAVIAHCRGQGDADHLALEVMET